jgi:hypothetical protein
MQIAAIKLHKIERVEHRDVTGTFAAQRLKVCDYESVRPDHQGLAIKRETLGLEKRCALGDSRQPFRPIDRIARKSRTWSPSRRTIIRYPSGLISWHQPAPIGGLFGEGWEGTAQ